ncbi:hypothetical protein HBA55_25260 [Pseudomaricurvus alkylphenolicus]|nr:hypothetical protein [Pseudomaricurvus alkylphenolicus]
MKDKLSEWQMPNDPIMESLQADVDFLTARIQALQNHPSAYESLRAAKQELQVKKQAIANRSRFLEHS